MEWQIFLERSKPQLFVKDLYTAGKIMEFTAFHVPVLLLTCELLFSLSTS